MSDTCTICEVNPPLGIGVGSLKKTCVDCIGKLQADGVCPVCRGVDLGTPEHIGVCNGKLPKLPKAAAPKKGTTRSATSIGSEAAAAKRLDQRRAKAEVGRRLMDEHGPVMDWKFEEVKKRLTRKTIQFQDNGKLHELRVKRVKSVDTREGVIVLTDELNGDEHKILAVTIKSIL